MSEWQKNLKWTVNRHGAIVVGLAQQNSHLNQKVDQICDVPVAAAFRRTRQEASSGPY